MKNRYIKPHFKKIKVKVFFMTRRSRNIDGFLLAACTCGSASGCCSGEMCTSGQCY